MGRSGGSVGGGGRSGGSFGGGHTGGGRSFGGRSGGSVGGVGRSGNSFGSRRPNVGYHRVGYPGGRFYGGYPGGGYRRSRRGGTGCLSTMIVLLVFVVIVGVAFSTMRSGSQESVKNTTERTPLVGQVNKTDWYEDDIGWITERTVLIEGLEVFYKETGVQPFVLFVPYSEEYWNGNNFVDDTAQAYLEQIYSEKFTDEAHFIFAYFECRQDSKQEMEGQFQYLSGYSADTVMDNEARSILWGYLTAYYNDTSYTIEEMLSNTFAETGKSIMSKPTNGWDFAKIAIAVVGVVAVVVCVLILVKTVAKRRKEKEEYTKKILETPLETFGTQDDTADLENKYQNKP